VTGANCCSRLQWRTNNVVASQCCEAHHAQGARTAAKSVASWHFGEEEGLQEARKEDKINAAKERAAMRNPDEFYFGMHNSQVVDGRHRKTVAAKQKELEEQVGGPETIRIMKDQDLSYIRMQKQKDAKKIEKMRASLHYIDNNETKKRKHTVFVDSQEEAKEFDVAKHFDTLPELAGRAFNRPRLESLKDAARKQAGLNGSDDEDTDEKYLATPQQLAVLAKYAKLAARKAAKQRALAYSEVEARTKRVAAMERAEAHLITEKLVASKGRKRKIKAAEQGQPAQYKWRRRRAK
jgi:U3 small nucleolar RNA-associated protein 11